MKRIKHRGFEDPHWAERAGGEASTWRPPSSGIRRQCYAGYPLLCGWRDGRVFSFFIALPLADVSNTSRPTGRCNHGPFVHAYQWQDEWSGWCSNRK